MKHALFFVVCMLAVVSTSLAQGRRCYGNTPCNACTTCSGCKHCNEGGGTCGVCSSGKHYSGGSYGNGGSGSKSEYKPKIIPTQKKAVGDIYKVTASTLNLRTEPGTTYSIVTELPYGTLVSLVTTSGSWLQVRVVATGVTGYVLSTYIVKY